MATRRCALRGCALTADNDTEEHIIPNAIGGRRRVRGFICRDCNSDTGSEWDDELARHLSPFSIHMGIKRQRGNVPSQNFPTASGQSIRVNADGTMTLTKPKRTVISEGNTTRINVSARSRKELRQVLKGLQRNYPNLKDADIDKGLQEAQDNFYYSSDPIEIRAEFGGTAAGRSLVKSAVALVFDAGIDPSHCDLAMNYLLEEDGEPCFGYYYVHGKDLVANRPAKSPFHCVHVIGRSSNSTLLGYVEFYGLWRMVLCLSETYSGEDFSHTYAIDPIEGKDLNILVNMDLSVSEIRQAYKCELYDNNVFHVVLRSALDTIGDISYRQERDRVIERAITTFSSKTGIQEGDAMTEELARRLVKDITAELLPFVIHNWRPPIFPKDTKNER